MGEVDEKVVPFSFGADIKNHRYVLDYLLGIDLEASMTYLPVTVDDPCVTQLEYEMYLHNYIEDELQLLTDQVVGSDPKLWKRAAETIQAQLEHGKVVRFVITLTDFECPTGPTQELHEIITQWDADLGAHVMIGYNVDHQSLVTIATYAYLNPEIEGFTPDLEPTVVIVKS